ncbi:hypothetical protein ACFO1B_51015 [Dactylosporangium siamense]|uniref:Uncharacterized protein n=1 Tax=Dactylosporangium siamense TaxID=685454 RepID=A0A919Q114_9ACTN|nr:hypothetical protein [Dactylosporangium siamense]GIG52403.1 hypothetical protein Dsi01nite_104440 [Dactylosporangium siamense]
MTVEGPLLVGLWHKVVGMLPDAASPWCLAALTLTLVAARAGYRVLVEWQRRVTFDRIFANAPGGSVVVQGKEGVAGSAMRIWVGHGTVPGAHVPERKAVIVSGPSMPVKGGRPTTHDR